MDKLTLADQQKVKKMSDERLRIKLIDAGYNKDDIDLIERDELFELYAQLLAQSQAHISISEPLAQEATGMGDNIPPTVCVSGDDELERQMFEFEKRKWEAEMEACRVEQEACIAELEQRRAERKLREAEQEAHRIEQEQSSRKWEAEREDRKAEVRLKEAEFALKRDEAAKQDTNVGKSKIFSDAMQSSAIRMRNDPIEAVAFFMNVEQLFDVYNVPADLKALLIRPYLNDKPKSIVSKLTPEVAGDYSRLKDALLHEFKLSPNTYLERFNTCRKGSEETFVAFASKLKGLLNYYLNSRYVTDFAQLC